MHSRTISSSYKLLHAIMMLSAGRRIAIAFNNAAQLSRQLVPLQYNVICHMSSMQHSYDYNSLKVSELRDLLRENDLPISGIKAELVERLNSAHITNKNPSNLQFMQQTGDAEDWDDEILDDDEEGDDDPNQTFAATSRKETGRKKSGRESRSERGSGGDDFRSTRVFVQGIPKDASWQELKDHFQVAGQVAFASISVDRKTGESKQCGIVQYESAESARLAIREMRNKPMNGAKLYVREDVQESRSGRTDGWERPQRSRKNEDNYKVNMPSEWRRANDEDGKEGQEDLHPEEVRMIEKLVKERDHERRQRNWKVSDEMRDQLKEEFGIHLDDTLKIWWTDVNGKLPKKVSDIKGEGRWGKQQPWRQIPTVPEYDAQVDSERVMTLLNKRDKARKVKDFKTADKLLQMVYDTPENGLGMRIHDQSRTWRIWTEHPPPKKGLGGEEMTAEEMCLKLVEDNDPDKVHEIKTLLKKFPGREWAIFKKLRERYDS